MDERKKRILHAIIQDYVQSAEPVGSRTLAKKYNLGISSATVRNEMSDLEELGFLEQPHTSAGRIPSAKGYRFYVDSLLDLDGPEREDAEQIHQLWQQQPGSFGDFFHEATRLISQISHNMSLFLAPAHDTSLIRYIHVLPIGLQHAVMVVVTDTGALDNEPVYFPDPVSVEDLTSASIQFNNVLQNVFIKDITKEKLLVMIRQLDGIPRLYVLLAETLYRAITKRKLFYSIGTTNLLQQPEFRDVEKVHPILSLLEKEELGRLVSQQGDHGVPLSISIGTENKEDSLKDLSLIKADFTHQNERLGTLAILGPTRMEYRRIIGLLTYMQRFMDTLTDSKKK